MIHRLIAVALFPLALLAADSAAELARMAREAGLDPAECYRIRDLNFSKEDVRLYLTDGYLILGKPVAGRRISAVFSADVEGGDGEILVLPPNRSERLSLANFTGSPNLSEHFSGALLIFTDDTAAVLEAALQAGEGARKSPEMGALLQSQWEPVLRNLVASFEVRVVLDLLSQRPERGYFYAAISGRQLGNFDAIFDPCSREQVALGQVAYRDTRAFFDNWIVFPARSYRTGRKTVPGPDFELAGVRIEATLEPDLTLKARTGAALTPRVAGLKALLFEMARQMRIDEVSIDGEPAEFFQRDSLRANMIRGGDNDLFLVIPPHDLPAGRPARIEFSHQGKVIAQAGNQVYYVGARGTWYPQRGLQFATYDLTFRYPRDLNLVSTGDVVEDRTEGEWRITRRRTASPIRMAGFNLGHYEQEALERDGFRVEVYANRRVEAALQPRPTILDLPQPWHRAQRRPTEGIPMAVEPVIPNPVTRLRRLAEDMAAAFEFMGRNFGTPPLKTLTVAPIPGAFGQGFPGLIYLSTVSYLEPRERPADARGGLQQVFFSDILQAHEIAHQWWGNTVTSTFYQDDWLMEALANYSALLFLEKKNGPRALEDILSLYRERLLKKNAEGKTLESAGPVIWGARLHSSLTPDAWRSIMYEKGSWILHMLRRRTGDAQFLKMLGEICRRYRHQPLGAEQFREIARQFLPPGSRDPQLEEFFDYWIYGTGVPAIKFEHSVRGKAPALRLNGTISLREVDEHFGAEVPIEIQFRRGKPIVHWVHATTEPSSFTLNLKQPPTRVVLAPGDAILSQKP
ncbi:MAG: hypothetical protein HY822_17145 [Acidobacteria bacterium]|nr:hypothetical protein [Acidobacteriota bacterium]